MQEYNYIVENDSLEVCIEQIHALLQSIHFENKNQKNLIENIRKTLTNTGKICYNKTYVKLHKNDL